MIIIIIIIIIIVVVVVVIVVAVYNSLNFSLVLFFILKMSDHLDNELQI